MTSTPAPSGEMDHLDQLGAKAFDGFLVRKDLVRKYSRQYPVPTYVVEFLLGRYCASTDPAEIEEGLKIVEKQLQGRTVRTGEEKLFKARARDQGSVKIIDIMRAKLVTRSDSYLAEVPSLAIKDAQINDELVRAMSVCSPMAFKPRCPWSKARSLPRNAMAGRFASLVCGRSKCPIPTCWGFWPRAVQFSARLNGVIF